VSSPDSDVSATPLQEAPQDNNTWSFNKLGTQSKFWEKRIKRIIDNYLNGDAELPRWKLQRGSDEMRTYVDGLNLPTLHPSSPFPSLLLHNLGHLSHDKPLAKRIKELFARNIRPRLLFSN
jgi:hypothetical protein